MKATNTEKYIQKNNIVEVMQLTPEAYRDVPDFIGKNFASFESGCDCECDFVPISMYTREYIKIEILNPYTSINNVITLRWNDYIIKDQNGNIYTLPKDVFESCFVEIGENTCKVELNLKHNQNENIEEALKQFDRWFDKYLEDRLGKIVLSKIKY